MNITDRLKKAVADFEIALSSRKSQAARDNVEFAALRGLLAEVMEDNKSLADRLQKHGKEEEIYHDKIRELTLEVQHLEEELQANEDKLKEYEDKGNTFPWPKGEPGLVSVARLHIDWLGAETLEHAGNYNGSTPYRFRRIMPLVSPGYIEVQEDVSRTPREVCVTIHPGKPDLKAMGFSFPRVLAKGVADAIYGILGLPAPDANTSRLPGGDEVAPEEGGRNDGRRQSSPKEPIPPTLVVAPVVRDEGLPRPHLTSQGRVVPPTKRS